MARMEASPMSSIIDWADVSHFDVTCWRPTYYVLWLENDFSSPADFFRNLFLHCIYHPEITHQVE